MEMEIGLGRLPHIQSMNGKRMELTSAIVGMKQAELATRVQYAVVRKILDAQQASGAAAIQLIEAAGHSASRSGDALVAAATGLGASLDTYG